MYLKSLLCAAVVALVPMMSSAAVVNPGDSVVINAGDTIVGNNSLVSGTNAVVTFTAGTDLKIFDFVSLGSVGFNNGDDLALINFGYTSPDIAGVLDSYDAGEISVNGATTEASSTLSGFNLLAGEQFSFFFDYATGGTDVVSNQFNFQVGTVPLPAGGLLLLTALGGLGFARRRKQAA